MTTYTGAYTGAEHDEYLGYVKNNVKPIYDKLTFLSTLASAPVDTTSNQSISGVKTFPTLTASKLLRLNASNQLVSSSYDEINPATLPLLAASGNNFTAEKPFHLSNTALTHDGIVYMNNSHDLTVSSTITHSSLSAAIGRFHCEKLNAESDCDVSPGSFSWSEANTNPQTMEYTAAIPAFAKVLSVAIVCTGSTAGGTLDLYAYTSAPENFFLTGQCSTAGAVLETTFADVDSKIGISATARKLYVTGTPSVNWNTSGFGTNWEADIYITYISLT